MTEAPTYQDHATGQPLPAADCHCLDILFEGLCERVGEREGAARFAVVLSAVGAELPALAGGVE